MFHVIHVIHVMVVADVDAFIEYVAQGKYAHKCIWRHRESSAEYIHTQHTNVASIIIIITYYMKWSI